MEPFCIRVDANAFFTRDAMTDTPTTVFTRRHAVIAGAAASLAAAGVIAQDSTPSGTPAATPTQAPPTPTPTPIPPTPTPEPIPAHAITIVKGRAEYGEPKAGGNLSMYVQSAGLLNGNPVSQQQDMTLLYSVFEGLVRINPQTMDAEPGLARSWSWSDDGLTLTFQLRDDVRWHDGSTFTAEDAAFTVIAYRDDYDSGAYGFFSLVESVEATNATTLKITFTEPDGAFVWNAASMPMLQAASWKTLWDEFPAGEKTLSRADNGPESWIGTGPWRVADATADRVELTRFDDYYLGSPLGESLTLIAEDDEGARVDGWKKGEVDVLPINAHQLNSVWQEEGNLFVGPGSVSLFAAFNFSNPANATANMMVDMYLRLALSLSINRDRYADDVFFGFIDEHAPGIIPQPWLHDSARKLPTQKVDQARELLEQGGWADRDGDGIVEDLSGNIADLFLIVRDNERPELLSLLKGVQQDWSEIGVRLTIQELNADAFDARWVENRDYDLIAYSLTIYPAFNEFDLIGSDYDIRWNSRGWNPGGYFSAPVDAAINDWFAHTDKDAMITAAMAIQDGLWDDPFALSFGFPHQLVLVRPDVQGFNPNMFHVVIGSEQWWRGEGKPMVPTPTPEATPIATPSGTPEATPTN